MFLYPFLYPLTHFSQHAFGVYIGATVHEVAQVVAAARAVGEQAADTAVITKMLRVVLLAPVLVVIGRLRGSRHTGAAERMAFPWFVVWFAAVIAAQSLLRLQPRLKAGLIDLDTVLLSGAMFALGVSTRWDQLRQAGPRPLLLASTLFAGLVGGGYALTSLLAP
jgi:uncharacterized integral membrane protein (TIGR00698 family)